MKTIKNKIVAIAALGVIPFAVYAICDYTLSPFAGSNYCTSDGCFGVGCLYNQTTATTFECTTTATGCCECRSDWYTCYGDLCWDTDGRLSNRYEYTGGTFCTRFGRCS